MLCIDLTNVLISMYAILNNAQNFVYTSVSYYVIILSVCLLLISQ